MVSVLLRNLRLTIPLMLISTALGYAVSFPMVFSLDKSATIWLYNPQILRQRIKLLRGIPISKYEEYEARMDAVKIFQLKSALVGMSMGLIIAQTTFIVRALEQSNRGNEN